MQMARPPSACSRHALRDQALLAPIWRRAGKIDFPMTPTVAPTTERPFQNTYRYQHALPKLYATGAAPRAAAFATFRLQQRLADAHHRGRTIDSFFDRIVGQERPPPCTSNRRIRRGCRHTATSMPLAPDKLAAEFVPNRALRDHAENRRSGRRVFEAQGNGPADFRFQAKPLPIAGPLPG